MAYPKRAAAIVAEELNRLEIEQGLPEEAEEEQDSDYVEEEETSSKTKRVRRDDVYQGGDSSRLTYESKRRAEDILKSLHEKMPVYQHAAKARKIITVLLREEAEEEPEGAVKVARRSADWIDPMLERYVKVSPSSVKSIANNLAIVREVLDKFGTTEIQENVRFAGETVAVAKKVEKRVALEEAQQSRSGLDEMLSGISKKRGITTVEKSSYDWEKYKEEKNLKDELKDASKTGFVEKQSFLNRVDERQFEKERNERERERMLREASAPKKSGD